MTLRKLSETAGFKVADDSADIRGWRVLDTSGSPAGTVEELIFDPHENLVHYAVVALASGRRVLVPARRLDVQDVSHRVHFDGDAEAWATLREYRPEDNLAELEAEHRLPWHIRLLEERLHLGKKREQVGEVTITKRPVVEDVERSLELADEEVEIARRLVERPATGDERPTWEGDTLRVPVLGERLVVEKRPYVIEEILITKKRKPRTEQVHERLRREEVEIDQHGVQFEAAEPTPADRRAVPPADARPASPPTVGIVPEPDPDELR